MSMNGNMAGCGNTDLYGSRADIEYRYFYFIAYDKALVFLTCEYQHPCRYLRVAPDPAQKEACIRLPAPVSHSDCHFEAPGV